MVSDNAGGGRRGSRATASPELVAFVAEAWGLDLERPAIDLGGSSNLNLRLDANGQQYVARVHRPYVTADRVVGLQLARAALQADGVPVLLPRPTPDGSTVVEYKGRTIEVEDFSPFGGRMDSLGRLKESLPTLARMHAILAKHPVHGHDLQPAFANYVSVDQVVGRVEAAVERIKSWGPTAAELAGAELALTLARRIAAAEAPEQDGVPAQLVHGDFWDNNVLFSGDRLALVTDFDFAGVRPRIDDLALTLFFASQDFTDMTSDVALLRELVNIYDGGLDVPLTAAERRRLPFAMARQALWSVAIWVATLDEVGAARQHLNGVVEELRWAERLVGRVDMLQQVLSVR